MSSLTDLFPRCPYHGKPIKRRSCRACNAAYMRGYLRRRRYERPDRAIWDRARKRAIKRGIEFLLAKDSIHIPDRCPVLGSKIELRGRRSASSPSLDRIVPERGYIPGNVRVISDHANRVKGQYDLARLHALSENGPVGLRNDYRMVATYLEREMLLEEVRKRQL